MSATGSPPPTWPGGRSPTWSLGTDTELTRLPWVGHRSPPWEAEPLRWLGVNAGLRAMSWADRQEARTGRQSGPAQVVGRFLGA